MKIKELIESANKIKVTDLANEVKKANKNSKKVYSTVERDISPVDAVFNERLNELEKGGASGGADWDANEGEAGYIENRPFYQSPDNVVIYVEGKINSNGNIEGSDSSNRFYFNPTSPFISGETYTVKIDGIEEVTFTTSGSPDNMGGGGGQYLSQGSFSLGWDTRGFAPSYDKTAYVSIESNPEAYAGKTFHLQQVTSGEIKKLDPKFVDKKSDVVRGDFSQGDFFKVYPGKYNVSVKQYGYDVLGIDLIADDSMKDGKCYVYEGMIQLKSSVSLPISEDTIPIKINGDTNYVAYSVHKTILLSDNVPSTNDDKRQVKFKINYIYEQYGPLLFIEFTGMKQS